MLQILQLNDSAKKSGYNPFPLSYYWQILHKNYIGMYVVYILDKDASIKQETG